MDESTEGLNPPPAGREAAEGPAPQGRLEFPVVGIGASAGGLAALTRFFEHMPSASGMAFVVVVHLSPRHASDLAGLLQRATRMPVSQVAQAVRIEPDHVYVIPPTQHLAMSDGRLELSEARRPPGRHVVIDLFFRTLADAHRERAIAIVLTGTGSDGAVGLARVKEKGGVTFAQAPDDAEFDGMPTAAIGTGAVDWALPVAEMPAKLVELWANARRIELPPGAGTDAPVEPPPSAEAARRAEEALGEIMLTLRLRTGHDFRHYKRATVLRRLERRLQVNGVPDLPAYRKLLESRTPEAQALLKDLLISVTHFFRDREAFEALEREVMPRLFELAEGGEAVRAWVAGCATGEEAYSVAMLLADQRQEAAWQPQLQVFATDIDESALDVARAGLYPASIVTDVPPVRLRQYFTREGERYRVRKDLREHVLFTAHNLLRDPPFSRLDLVCCRNLLIYLDRAVQEEILQMFHFALAPDGWLFLGSSESADVASNLFTPVDKRHRIYRANAGARSMRRLPALPMGAHPREPALPAAATPAQRRQPSYAEAHQRLIEAKAPPSLLIDAGSNIVHLSAHVGRFLQHGAGAPSHQLLSVVRPELRVELRAALLQASQSGTGVAARRTRLPDDEGRGVAIQMHVQPVPPGALGALTLVTFEEVEEPAGARGGEGGDARDPLVARLEAELHRTEAQLQATLEHSQTSTEELKASNEELQAINEELRSATEELETSREELQAVNEELITVNQELKAKVEETAKVNDDLQNLIASTDIATVFVDRAMCLKRYTPRATRIFNLQPGDVGRSLLDITHRLTSDSLAEDAGRAFRTLHAVEREVRDQAGRCYLARALPYRTAEDRIDGAVLTFVDITERREAEERLHAEERRMRMVADSTRDYAIITFDAEGRVTAWNSGAERIFGHSREQALGQPNALIFTPEDRAAGADKEEMRQAREDGRAEDDRWHLRADGTRVFCSGILTPLREDGELRGYAKIARDLTGAKRTEREREALLRRETAARAEAIAAGELKDEFLAVMSHELKNPLNLIHLNAELLGRLPEAKALPSVARAAEVIRKTVLSQAQIIDDLLDLSRANTGKLSLAREAVDWGGIVTTIVGALAEEAVGQQVALSADLPPEPVVVYADPVRVEQIVWNLLSNALKFTPAGGEVSARLRHKGKCGVLEVRDNGRGIDPAHLPRLFGMFQQAGSPTARQERGLGIGLAVVSHLVRLHGGRVEGHSPGLGAGSTFTVWLPLHDAVERKGADAEERALPPGLRVLVIDDDRENSETLADLLRLEGVTVGTAFSAEEALQAIGREDFDVIVSDIAMPGTDGYALIGALRRHPRTSATPVIALTGFGRASDVQRASEAGFDAHLRKPATLERLTAALLEVLGRAPLANGAR